MSIVNSTKIDLSKIRFKNYCWSLGSTSFRVKDLNYKNEQLLLLFKEFWKTHKEWNNSSQVDFYDLMKEHQLLSGNASRKDKDARQKVIGLKELGLVNNDRKITEVGEALLNSVEKQNFSDDNIFGIDADSYLYLLQLLKMRPSTYVSVDDCDPYNDENSEEVKISNNQYYNPLIRLLYLLTTFEYLNEDEFIYLVPLTAYNFYDVKLIQDIKKIRNNEKNIDDILISKIMSMDNYKEAWKLFSTTDDIDLDIINIINMSRKGSSYDKGLYLLFEELKNVILLNSNDCSELLNLIKSQNSLRAWKKFIFNEKINSNNINKKSKSEIIQKNLLNIKTILELKEFVFKINHLTRWKNTLKDYADLNKRYFKLCDIISFNGNVIKLDPIANVYFSLIFKKTECQIGSVNQVVINKNLSKYGEYGLNHLISINEILLFTPEYSSIESELVDKYNIHLSDKLNIRSYLKQEKLNKFEKLIDNKFTNDKLITLLTYFEKRNELDREIQKEITDNANIPTLFEYVLAIAWHKINGRKGNILDSMNLSLDIDMLPKSHAAGGQADLLFKYAATQSMPKHQLLIEATLSDSTNQRRMEMEPVSRHLLQTIQKSQCLDDYAILIAPTIHSSVVSDFRSRSYGEISLDNEQFFDGIKILPLTTSMLKFALANNVQYEEIYNILENAHKSTLKLSEKWYEKTIKAHFIQA